MAFRDPTAWMWEEALELLESAERLQRQFFHLQASGRPRPTWGPPVDMFELEDRLVVVAALPGVRAEEVEVLLDAPLLVIRGQRPLPALGRSAAIRRLEIPHGHFERQFELPAGRYEMRGLAMDEGCLTFTLLRLQE